jgi:hypothetical protein
MKQKVTTWLQEGANPNIGIQLCTEAGANSFLIRIIKAHPEANKRMMVKYLCDKYGVDKDYSVNWKSLSVNFTPKTKSFRDEFKFLNEKNCPVELETLVTRKFSSYHRYVELHKLLRDCSTLEECAKTSRKLLDNYIENRLIWDELNYYKEHHTILGKHPVFKEFARRKELLHMSVVELVRREEQLKNNIWRVTNEIKKGNKPHLDIERRAKLSGYEIELTEVQRLINE